MYFLKIQAWHLKSIPTPKFLSMPDFWNQAWEENRAHRGAWCMGMGLICRKMLEIGSAGWSGLPRVGPEISTPEFIPDAYFLTLYFLIHRKMRR